MNAGPYWVLVEGLPGIGKSTTAGHLAEALETPGRSVHRIPEGGATPDVGLPWTYESADATLRSTTLEEYPFASWAGFEDVDVCVVDARWLQNTALFAMLRDDPRPWDPIPRRILSTLRHRACVVHLATTEPRCMLRASLASRRESHPAWASFVLPFFARQPWCQRHGWTGEAAYVETLSVWDEVSRRLLDAMPIPVHRVENPADDWDAAIARLADDVRASYAAACV